MCHAKAPGVMVRQNTGLVLSGLESNVNSVVTRIHIKYNLVPVTMG